MSSASTLASKVPWLVTTAAMSREGKPVLIVIGGSKAPRLVRDALPKEDVTRSIDDRHVGHAIAGQVSHERRVPRNQADRSGLSELAVPLVQLNRDAVGILETDGQVGFSVAGEVAGCDRGRAYPRFPGEARQKLEPTQAVTL